MLAELVLCLGVSVVEPCSSPHIRVYYDIDSCEIGKKAFIDAYPKGWFKEAYCRKTNRPVPIRKAKKKPYCPPTEDAGVYRGVTKPAVMLTQNGDCDWQKKDAMRGYKP